MKNLRDAFNAIMKCVPAVLGIQSRFLQEMNLTQRTQKWAPFPVQVATVDWPIKEDFEDTEPPKASTRFPHTKEPHVGLANSKQVSMDVVHLRVYGREFRRYVRTKYSINQAVIETINAFPNLQCLFLDDDYLQERDQEEIETLFHPVTVSWTYSLYIDGRHGR